MTTRAGAPCTICSHPRRGDIDKLILGGTSTMSDIARTYSVSRQSLMRHRDGHLTRSVREAAERERQYIDDAHDTSLLDQARGLHRRALEIMAEARAAGDLRTALAGIREATRLLELQGRFLGEINNGTVTVNLVASVEFKTLQVNIVAALAPYPEARAAVLQALGAPMIQDDG